MTAGILGTSRSGQGVRIRPDGLIVTVGYLVIEAEQVWVTSDDGRGTPAYVIAQDYDSGLTLLGVSLVPHGVTIGSPGLHPASLDHAMWFHRPFRADEWWLYDQWSPSASGGRGLSFGRVFQQDGTLVATVMQEGLIRRAR